ncbi:hypothetical protein DBIPINDM_004260 [Mesorhizobium sp. AR02]|uniref:DUF6665 family protein n=1 Tax=Mesorhizobium sp. AR02 TaxID=2865837 RepID=UPI00215E769C|nr:DUF6665 family protein [Mesorhizobium sp. AR02]UVK51050.1 hypothetical protein DBIPINDM_004260 [Mesorhizobium sp. AR02]
MSLRPPSHLAGSSAAEAAFDALGHEILAEKAAALGRAGQKVEETLARLSDNADEELRPRLLKEAAVAVHAYFIQRELCGLRRHEAVIREYGIPKAVLVRLGAM